MKHTAQFLKWMVPVGVICLPLALRQGGAQQLVSHRLVFDVHELSLTQCLHLCSAYFSCRRQATILLSTMFIINIYFYIIQMKCQRFWDLLNFWVYFLFAEELNLHRAIDICENSMSMALLEDFMVYIVGKIYVFNYNMWWNISLVGLLETRSCRIDQIIYIVWWRMEIKKLINNKSNKY